MHTYMLSTFLLRHHLKKTKKISCKKSPGWNLDRMWVLSYALKTAMTNYEPTTCPYTGYGWVQTEMMEKASYTVRCWKPKRSNMRYQFKWKNHGWILPRIRGATNPITTEIVADEDDGNVSVVPILVYLASTSGKYIFSAWVK